MDSVDGEAREAAETFTSETLAHIQGFDVFREDIDDHDDIMNLEADDDEEDDDNDSQSSEVSSTESDSEEDEPTASNTKKTVHFLDE